MEQEWLCQLLNFYLSIVNAVGVFMAQEPSDHNALHPPVN